MTKWQIYITANNGDDIPQELKLWDDDKEPLLHLRLAAFAKDAVIDIEPAPSEPEED